MSQSFGRLYAYDERDRKFLMHEVVMPWTRFVESRKWNPGWVGNQGNSPSCVGYGWAHWLSCDPINQFLDPMGLYKLAQSFDEWPGQNYAGTSVRAGARILKLLGAIKEYRWAESAGQVVRHILESGPVVVGTNWYSGMSNPDRRGWIKPSGHLLGGHCYLINAYYHRSRMLRIQNSYGYGWGSGGRAYIALEDFEYLLSQQGEACIGVEKPIQWEDETP